MKGSIQQKDSVSRLFCLCGSKDWGSAACEPLLIAYLGPRYMVAPYSVIKLVRIIYDIYYLWMTLHEIPAQLLVRFEHQQEPSLHFCNLGYYFYMQSRHYSYYFVLGLLWLCSEFTRDELTFYCPYKFFINIVSDDIYKNRKMKTMRCRQSPTYIFFFANSSKHATVI